MFNQRNDDNSWMHKKSNQKNYTLTFSENKVLEIFYIVDVFRSLLEQS